MNTGTETIITSGRHRVGPFEIEAEALAALPPPATVLVVECRTDGWYIQYFKTISTTMLHDKED